MRRLVGVVMMTAIGLAGPVVARAQEAPAPAASGQADHDHGQSEPAAQIAPMDHGDHPAAEALPPFIPPITDEARRAAFPDVDGHSVHDDAVRYFVLFDQLEWQGGDEDGLLSWDNTGWVGRDLDRLWFRTEGARENGRVDDAEVELLYGRAVGRWWDVIAGVRQDAGPGPARTWAAFGIQGLAPYWFEVEATFYLGASGRTAVRLESEYELLLTNRLVLQPRLEANLFGKADPDRQTGAGLGDAEAGLRLRYEFRREFAPYVGIAWHRVFFGTADRVRAADGETGDLRVVAGARFWL